MKPQREIAVDFHGDRVKARNLAAISKKRQTFEAEVQQAICFLRMVR